MGSTAAEPIYLNLSADDPELGATEIESMCVNCFKSVSLKIYFPESSSTF